MKHPIQQLAHKLDQARDLLDQPALFSLSPEEQEEFKAKANKLSQNLADLEGSRLTIGLLGGTGVGKSSLMNALAGSEIASTSDRRPHTDQVLIYRHAAMNQIPGPALKDVPWSEITHEADAIRHILLCDLPDFDSLMAAHRERVLNFLEYLDVLVWVTSPEKYADKITYEFMRMVPKARQNFYFVLNKADIFFSHETGGNGYEELGRVAKSYQDLIRDNGIEEPLLFVISAKKILDSEPPEPWNQFPAFRNQIFQQRDMKQIAAIKTANLDVEVKRLLSVFQREISNLETFEKILESTLAEVNEQRPAWVKSGEEAFDLWLNNYIKPHILLEQWEPAQLIGPGYLVGLLFQGWSKRSQGERPQSGVAAISIPDEIAVFFQRRLQWLQDRLSRLMLHHNLPSAAREQLEEAFDISKIMEELKDHFTRFSAMWLAEGGQPRFWGHKILQTVTYLLILVFFLFAIGGQEAWQRLLDNPGISSLIGLIAASVETIFSSRGLAALSSFALLNLFFAFRFYRRGKKRSEAAAKKILKSLKGELTKIWEEKIDAVLSDINRLRQDIRSQISTISELTRERD